VSRSSVQQMTFGDLEMKARGLLSGSLKAIDELLDHAPGLVERVHQDLIAGLKKPRVGREGLRPVQVLRSLLLRRMENLDLRSLRDRIDDGVSWRVFTGFDAQAVPGHDAFNRAFNKLMPETIRQINQILLKQTKAAKGAREAKVPFDDFLGSLYVLPGAKVKGSKLEPGESWPYMKNTFGFPASGFKGAVVSACSFVSGVPKTIVRGALHVLGDFVPINYDRLVMRQDIVRVGKWNSRVADIRFRGEFQDWDVVIKVRYDISLLTIEQIVNLFARAGFAVGIGEWRPEKGGSWGTFQVE